MSEASPPAASRSEVSPDRLPDAAVRPLSGRFGRHETPNRDSWNRDPAQHPDTV